MTFCHSFHITERKEGVRMYDQTREACGTHCDNHFKKDTVDWGNLFLCLHHRLEPTKARAATALAGEMQTEPLTSFKYMTMLTAIAFIGVHSAQQLPTLMEVLKQRADAGDEARELIEKVLKMVA